MEKDGVNLITAAKMRDHVGFMEAIKEKANAVLRYIDRRLRFVSANTIDAESMFLRRGDILLELERDHDGTVDRAAAHAAIQYTNMLSRIAKSTNDASDQLIHDHVSSALTECGFTFSVERSAENDAADSFGLMIVWGKNRVGENSDGPEKRKR